MEGGLHPYAVADGLSDALDDLVHRSTRAEVVDRLPSAERFLDLLDEGSSRPQCRIAPRSGRAIR